MTRSSYPSDLTDGEWHVLEPLLPAAKPHGRPRSADMREILNGVFYILRSGCALRPLGPRGLAWRMMPHDLPKWNTVVIVTHNMQQAGRVSDRTAFMHLGVLVEEGPTNQIFTNPKHEMTERYVEGRFG